MDSNDGQIVGGHSQATLERRGRGISEISILCKIIYLHLCCKFDYDSLRRSGGREEGQKYVNVVCEWPLEYGLESSIF